MAEARSAVETPPTAHVESEEDAPRTADFIRIWRRQVIKRFFRARNMIRNGMWPTSIYNLGVTTGLFSLFMVTDWEWSHSIAERLWSLDHFLHLNRIPYIVRIPVASFAGGVVFFIVLMYMRRWTLRLLLSYRGWMYEPPRSQSFKTKCWGLVVRLISGYSPTMYSCQKSLPFLPVPALSSTIRKFLESVKPLYAQRNQLKDFQQLQVKAKEFEKGTGPRLQRVLQLKALWVLNWCTDWWEKYVYLMSRSPIAINSNYYILDQSYWQPTHRQVSRAANTIYHYMQFKRMIDRETVPPLLIRNTIPICMAQYERAFSTTRIPGEEIDHLVNYSSNVSKHVSVMRKGVYYKMSVFDSEGRLMLPQNLERQIEWIIEDADKHSDEYSVAQKNLAALTAVGRADWARTRSAFFSEGVNRESLETIEQAVFHVVLETLSYDAWSDRAKHLIHGTGGSLWFDKSINTVFFTDGRYGQNIEHSWGDAPIMGHIGEFFMTKEVVEGLYDSDGFCLKVDEPQSTFKKPERLIWDFPVELESKISKALEFNQQCNEDLDLCVVDHKAFGKGFIKTLKVSPDAFVQLALQLAYFHDAQKFALTYEASMTRLYRLGRTETVRSLTEEGAAFVLAMCAEERDKALCIKLLRTACAKHTLLYKDAMNGKGIDRHLFGLYVVSRGLGYDCEFLKDALMMPWTLSTSQQPQQQMPGTPDCNLPQFKDKVCPGGGFGPVSDQGYGVSYMLPGDARLFFHVSSKRSCSHTDSQQFTRLIFESLADMKSLFDD